MGPDGLLANKTTAGGLFIDCSTIDPVASKVGFLSFPRVSAAVQLFCGWQR